MSTSRNLPWVEKYRPQQLDDLISHVDIIGTINQFLKEDRLPHLLFYGPPGTGKTSTILAVAKQIYSPKEFNSMVLELNASDDRGIGIVRGQVLNFASTRTIFKTNPAHLGVSALKVARATENLTLLLKIGAYATENENSRSGFKLVILDEADAMTKDAQNALRRVIEKFTENTRFCIICNYLSKIIPALQSRCTRFRFGPLKSMQMVPRLTHVINQESVNVTEDGVKALVTLANGDMRRALNILQSTSMAYNTVDEDNVYTCVGHPLRRDIENIVNWLLNESFVAAYNNLLDIKTEKGLALQDILSEVHAYVHRVDLPVNVKIHLLVKMADIEHCLASGTNERIQLSALVASFQSARDLISEAAS